MEARDILKFNAESFAELSEARNISIERIVGHDHEDATLLDPRGDLRDVGGHDVIRMRIPQGNVGRDHDVDIRAREIF